MDAEEKFLKNLRLKRRNDLHLRFFNEDQDIQFICCPIVTTFTAKKRIRPYRFVGCGTPECVYDESELTFIFNQSGLSNFLTFICRTCKKQINLSNFWYDEALAEMINDVWTRYNEGGGKLNCEKVRIFRDGIWEPIIPLHVKKLEENLRNSIQGHPIEKERKVLGFTKQRQLAQSPSSVQQQLQQKIQNGFVAYKNIFKLSDYDKKEYFTLLYKYQQENNPFKNPKQIMIQRYGENISNEDLLNLQKEEYFSTSIMSFFIQYLLEWAYRNVIYDLSYNKTLYNKKTLELNESKYLLYAVIKVFSYDAYNKITKYQIHSSNFNQLINLIGRDNLVTQIDQAYIILFYDNRWILTITNPRYSLSKIIDFLPSDLTKIKPENIQNIISYIVEKELYPMKVINREDSFEVSKVYNLNDCGIQISNYMYRSIIQERTLGVMPYFDFKNIEKIKIRDLISWLFAKYYYENDKEEKVILPIQSSFPQKYTFSSDLIRAQDSSQYNSSSVKSQSQSQSNSKMISNPSYVSKQTQEMEESLAKDWDLSFSGSQFSQQSQSLSNQYMNNNNQNQNSSLSNNSDYNSNSQNSQSNQISQQKISKNNMRIKNTRQSALLQQYNPRMKQNRGSILDNLLRNGTEIDFNKKEQKSSTPSQESLNLSDSSNVDKQKIDITVPTEISNLAHHSKPPETPPPPPYFETTKEDLVKLLYGWHQTLLKKEKKAQEKREEYEKKRKEFLEQKQKQSISPQESDRTPTSLQSIDKDQQDLQKLSDLQEKMNYKKRIEKIDKLMEKELQPQVIEHLPVEELYDILVRLKQQKIDDNTYFSPNEFGENHQLFNSMKTNNPQDQFYQYLGLDINTLDQKEFREINSWNRQVQESLSLVIQQRQKEIEKQRKEEEKLNRKHKHKHKHKHRSKSKKHHGDSD